MSVAAATIQSEALGARVLIGSPVYGEIAEFLYEEALHLDRIELMAWAGMLADDLIYTAPVRVNRPLNDQAATVVRTVKHLDETRGSILGRIARLTKTKSAWAEDPPSRTRRLVTNILVNETANPNEYHVISYLLLTRSRFNQDTFQIMSAERADLIRRTDAGLRLARREILLDQATLGMPNLAIFL